MVCRDAAAWGTMKRESTGRADFGVRFGCGFVFFGLVLGLLGLRVVDLVGVPSFVACGLVMTVVLSWYVARVGDAGWGRLLGFFRWW